MPSSIALRCAAIAGATAVGFGAFGAHGLKDQLSPDLMAIYQTGVLYHLMHAVSLLALGLWLSTHSNKWVARSAGLMALGIVLFSGSLYTLAITGERCLGAITPLGGLSWLIAWSCLLFAKPSAPHTDRHIEN